MAHPEVRERVALARQVVDAITVVAYATGAAQGMAAGFSEDSGLDLEPAQAITYVVTMYYGGIAAGSGRARLGDVRFTQEMLPFDPGVRDSRLAAAALHRYVGYPAGDLWQIVHTLLSVPTARAALPPGVNLERGLRELADQARAGWTDAALNATVDPGPTRAPRGGQPPPGGGGSSRSAVHSGITSGKGAGTGCGARKGRAEPALCHLMSCRALS